MKTIITLTLTLFLFFSNAQSIINIEDFGGIADGRTNNNQAFFNAITHLNNNGGGVLNLQPGQYILTDTVKEFVLNFHTINDIDFKGNKTEIIGIYGDNASRGIFYIENMSNCNFSGISFRGENVIDFDTIKAEYFLPNYNIVAAFNISGNLKDVNFHNCDFKYFGGVAVNIYGTTKRVSFEKCYFVGSIKDLSIYPSIQPTGILFGGNESHNNIKIYACDFYNFIDVSGTNNAHGLYFRKSNFANVINCTFEVDKHFDADLMPNGGLQIFSGQSSFLNLENNSFINVHNYCFSAAHVNWANNFFKDSKISINSNHTTLLNNTFEITRQTANEGVIYIERADYLSIFENSFIHAENSSSGVFNPLAIRFNNNSTGSSIKRNTFVNFNVGITLGATDSYIQELICQENTFYGGPNSRHGIDLRSCVNCSFENNLAFSSENETLNLIITLYVGIYYKKVFFENNKCFGTAFIGPEHY